MEAGDYDAAWDRFQGALGTFHTEAKDFHEARKIIDDGDRTVREVRSMGMDLRDPERLLRQGRESLDRRDVAGAPPVGPQVQGRLKGGRARCLPGQGWEGRGRVLCPTAR